ncbi:hypothetical protein KQY27_05900 [Methanobrevibacter sp. TMH8]|uniref:hypothetical protein n=1 Tax=Methanobrevibacter sp. TMH8 TaxID=2848611 RepID=UPI001CC9EFAC|nr:hypothetical protein [Methanobrevibacter sp. TMH8]MBZ9571070.1 hypothetical protein [Methanobrevibacter sp. TMH8]
MITKEKLLNIFEIIMEEEVVNGLKSELNQEDDIFSFVFEESHFIFVNNVTIAFNKINIDEDNIHFYFDNEAIAGIAILNIENISN